MQGCEVDFGSCLNWPCHDFAAQSSQPLSVRQVQDLACGLPTLLVVEACP